MYPKRLIKKESHMPKNRVQFYSGWSLRDFLMRYRTDDQITQALFQVR